MPETDKGDAVARSTSSPRKSRTSEQINIEIVGEFKSSEVGPIYTRQTARKKLCQEKAKRIKDRMHQKREQLMFARKVALIQRHLLDSEHPLAWLQKTFSEELKDYYELFLEENRGHKNGSTQSTLENNMMNQSQKSVYVQPYEASDQYKLSELDTSGANNLARHHKFIKQSFLTQRGTQANLNQITRTTVANLSNPHHPKSPSEFRHVSECETSQDLYKSYRSKQSVSRSEASQQNVEVYSS